MNSNIEFAAYVLARSSCDYCEHDTHACMRVLDTRESHGDVPSCVVERGRAKSCAPSWHAGLWLCAIHVKVCVGCVTCIWGVYLRERAVPYWKH